MTILVSTRRFEGLKRIAFALVMHGFDAHDWMRIFYRSSDFVSVFK
jgi:hypothetical protein